MGDRGNIAVLQDGGDQVWFYGHWAGSGLKQAVQAALNDGQSRWQDEAYLARIIFCRFCGEKNHNETTGFGISCQLQDNEYPILVVDIPGQRVFEVEEDSLNDDGKIPKGYNPAKTWSFVEFAAMTLTLEK